MITNNEICTKYKIKEESRLYFILNDIRENIKNHDKKEDG